MWLTGAPLSWCYNTNIALQVIQVATCSVRLKHRTEQDYKFWCNIRLEGNIHNTYMLYPTCFLWAIQRLNSLVFEERQEKVKWLDQHSRASAFKDNHRLLLWPRLGGKWSSAFTETNTAKGLTDGQTDEREGRRVRNTFELWPSCCGLKKNKTLH